MLIIGNGERRAKLAAASWRSPPSRKTHCGWKKTSWMVSSSLSPSNGPVSESEKTMNASGLCMPKFGVIMSVVESARSVVVSSSSTSAQYDA